MNNVVNLFSEEQEPVCIGHMAVGQFDGWKLYFVNENGTLTEWLWESNKSRIYKSLDDVRDFFSKAGIKSFMVREGVANEQG